MLQVSLAEPLLPSFAVESFQFRKDPESESESEGSFARGIDFRGELFIRAGFVRGPQPRLNDPTDQAEGGGKLDGGDG